MLDRKHIKIRIKDGGTLFRTSMSLSKRCLGLFRSFLCHASSNLVDFSHMLTTLFIVGVRCNTSITMALNVKQGMQRICPMCSQFMPLSCCLRYSYRPKGACLILLEGANVHFFVASMRP